MSEYYEVIGSTEVLLEVSEQAESNLGNVVCDSMVAMWEDTTMAFVNNGGLRTSLIEGIQKIVRI